MRNEWDAFFDQHYLKTATALEPEDSRGEIAAAMELVGAGPGSEILDCACGYGRHTLPLAYSGYRAIGLDRSEVLLAEAASRRVGDQPFLVRGDFRSLPFRAGTFDAALSLYNSFGYYGDTQDRAILDGLFRVLKPQGVLLLQVQHRDRILNHLKPLSNDRLPDGSVLTAERSFDSETGIESCTQVLTSADGEKQVRSFDLRIYSAEELDTMLSSAGFARVEHFGSLTGDPVNVRDYLVLVARKVV